jgi:hypothetical protein
MSKQNPIRPHAARKIRDFSDRLLARRAVPWQQLFDPVAPGIFIGWVRRNEIAFPQALEDGVRARGNHIIDWKRNYDELKEMYDELSAMLDKTRKDDLEFVTKIAAQRDEAFAQLEALRKSSAMDTNKALPASNPREISTREKDSLLRLIAGMAVIGYGYDARSKRSEQVTEITSDLESAGVPLDADTVRKWLRASAELLPGPKDE